MVLVLGQNWEFHLLLTQRQRQNCCHGNSTKGAVSFVMHICGAKFQEHCFNISRDVAYSEFHHFLVANNITLSWSNLHNRKTLISLKRKEIFQIEKRHSSEF